MRLQIILVTAVIIGFPLSSVSAGNGFRSNIRDFVGPSSPNTYGVYTVEQVIENHSVVLVSGHQVRYIGVGDLRASAMDSSEIRTAYGFHKQIVFTKMARLEFDKNRRDGQGNLHAYVFVKPWPSADNELFVNAELIRLGYARFVPDDVNTKYNQLFRRHEEEAILARRGIWAAPVIRREEY